MKIIQFFICFSFSFAVFNPVFSQKSSFNMPNTTPTPIQINIGSGGPGGYAGDCDGSGFCGCTPTTFPFQVLKYNKVVVGHALTQEGKLFFTTDRKNMTEDTFNKYFKSGVFVVESNFTFDAKLSKQLGFSSPYTIKSGKYKVIEKEGALLLIF